MSFDRRFEQPNFNEDIDLSECQTCEHTNYDFTCGEIGYCIKKCGESYVVGKLLQEKGYRQVNLDYFILDGLSCNGIEMSNRECKKLMKNLQELGYTSILHHHPLQKNYLSTVIIENHNPIELCHVFLNLDVIK